MINSDSVQLKWRMSNEFRRKRMRAFEDFYAKQVLENTPPRKN